MTSDNNVAIVDKAALAKLMALAKFEKDRADAATKAYLEEKKRADEAEEKLKALTLLVYEEDG